MEKGEPVVKLDEQNINRNLKVYDVVYNRKTELLKEAEKLGLESAGGVGMLARQGAEAFQLWSEIKVDEDIIAKMIEYLRKEVCKND
jgi:shikimate 5-dehydrogenase